jgi:hypothetical protein
VHTYYAFVLPWYPRARARNHPTHIVCMRIRLTPHTPRPQLVAAAASTRTGARRMSSLVAPLASGLGDKNGANIVQNVSTLFATLPGGNAPVRAELTEVLGKGVERDYMDKTWAGVNGATVKKRGNVQKAAPVLRIKYHSEVRQHNKKTQFSRKHSLLKSALKTFWYTQSSFISGDRTKSRRVYYSLHMVEANMAGRITAIYRAMHADHPYLLAAAKAKAGRGARSVLALALARSLSLSLILYRPLAFCHARCARTHSRRLEQIDVAGS